MDVFLERHGVIFFFCGGDVLGDIMGKVHHGIFGHLSTSVRDDIKSVA